MATETLLMHLMDLERGAFIMFCLCWAYYFVSTRKKPWRVDTRMRYLFGGLMVWKAAVLLSRTVVWFPQTLGNEHLILLAVQLDMMTVAWVVLGLTALSRRRRMQWWLFVVHFAPMVAMVVLNFCCLAPWVWWLSRIYIGVYAIVFFVLCGLASIRYNRHVHEVSVVYSKEQLTRSAWLMIFMIVQFSLWWFSCFFTSTVCGLVFYALSMVVWTCANVMTEEAIESREASPMDMKMFSLPLHETEASREIPEAEESVPEGNTEEEESAMEEVFARRLRTICEETKLYAKDGVSRDEMAKAMHVNHTYFSQMLRKVTGKTFYEYVNGLRMDDAQRLLNDPNFPLDMIPWEIGYRHKSTYYRAFQERFGCKPQEWREKNVLMTSE